MIRIASAALLIVLVLTTLWWLPAWATLVLVTVVSALAAGEVAGLAAHVGARVSSLFVAGAAALVTLAFAADAVAVSPGVPLMPAVLLALTVAGGALVLSSGLDAGTLTRAGVTLMAPIYAGAPLGSIAALRATEGAGAVFLLLLVVTVSDSAQFYTGRLVGHRKLAPVVSPGKTVEGAIGGFVAATLVCALTGPRLLDPGHVSVLAFAGLGAALSLTGIVGDLFESLLKRGAGVKDSSSLIPGHGGVLDRIDSYLFAAPLFYLFVRIAA